EDLEKGLSEWLLAYVLTLFKKAAQATSLPPEVPTTTPEAIIPPLAAPASESEKQMVETVPVQLVHAIEAAKESMTAGPAHEKSLDAFEIARFNLYGLTLFSEKYSSEFLPNHLVHLLYNYRDRLEVSPQERRLILRNLIFVLYDLTVVCYWLLAANASACVTSPPATFRSILA